MNATTPPEWRQSLADGAPGMALLHIERASAGLAGWGPVHHFAEEMTRAPVQASSATASLFYGAPAVAYALHVAGQASYAKALTTLDVSIQTLIRLRLDAAHRRIDRGLIVQAREYDLIHGLTGLGAYLMHRQQDHELLRDLLGYLVRLTRPIQADGQILPGWWAAGSPDRRQSRRWNAGHAGFGMAHGIAGPLALLSITMRRGVIVDGHDEAIRTICAFLGRWRSGNGSQAWWPEVISCDELRNGAVSRPGPHRPSWCYGTPGIARAQHLAALALGDLAQARRAEQAFIGCLTDDRQLAHLSDLGLCHGWAGLVHTARRAHADTPSSELAAAIEAAASALRKRPRNEATSADEGFLEGNAGIELANSWRDIGTLATTQWDTCLLVG